MGALLPRVCLWVALLGGSLGCSDPAPCGMREEPVTGFDGGVFRCIKAEDCPRPSNVFVCATDAVETKDCVRCAQTQCVRKVPVTCP